MYYAGIALAGLGAGAILRASFREDSFDNENDRRTTTLIGATLLGAGIPLTIVGGTRIAATPGRLSISYVW